MPLSIKHITEKHAWEGYVKAAAAKSFLQGWNWGEFHRGTGHTVERIAICEDGNCILFCQVFIVKARRGSFVFCPHGPLALEDDGLKRALPKFVEALKGLALKYRCSFIRLSPLLIDTAEHRAILAQNGFKDAPSSPHPELSWMLDLSLPEDQLLQNMRKNTRYSVKKAEKDGVEVKLSAAPEDIEIFWKVYETTVKRQQFTPFSKKYLRTEFETFAQDDRARFFFAMYQGEVISAALIIYDDVCGYYHHGASTQAHPKITGSYLILWHAILEAKRRGCQYFNFWGVVPEDQVKHPWAGLSLFKRGFGGFEEAYVHAQDLPLSLMYWMTFLIERIRRWRRRL